MLLVDQTEENSLFIEYPCYKKYNGRSVGTTFTENDSK